MYSFIGFFIEFQSKDKLETQTKSWLDVQAYDIRKNK